MASRDPNTERAIVLRKFDGVNLLVDQAYLGPSYLRAAQNWIPGETFRLTKTPGNAAYPGGNIPGVDRVMKMIRAYTSANRYLYAVADPTAAGGDQLWVSIDDGAWVRVALAGGGDADFASSGQRYDMEILNGFLYVGNGVDPILRVTLGGTAIALTPVTAFTDGSAVPTPQTQNLNFAPAEDHDEILTGTYSYAWAIFDHTADRWVERGQTREVTLNDNTNNAYSVPTPTGMANALSAQFRAHLFLAPINLPIEFGHDQNPEGLSAAGVLNLRTITTEGHPLPLRGVARTGRYFRGHLGRLWIAGDQANVTATWATYAVVPGLEQDVFNAGIFFPVNARLPRTFDDITAIGLASTGSDTGPEVPMVVCTLSDTYLNYGDILDDPSQTFRHISQTIGCISNDTFVETPMGTIFVGLQSVYLIPPGGGTPVDVGWPIRPAIVAIPANQRYLCTAIYHKGFYKLAIVPAGQVTAVQQWWLDLRQGIEGVPSWWGPNVRVAPSCWCTADQDPDEVDRGFMAIEGTGIIEMIHQPNTYSENAGTVTIISILTTGDLDDGQPFDRKTFQRIRVTAFPGDLTSLQASISVDGLIATVLDPLPLEAPGGAIWNVDQWNIAQWAQSGGVEGETITAPPRPRGRNASVQLVHSQSVALSLRDFELRYIPVPRVTRLLSTDSRS